MQEYLEGHKEQFEHVTEETCELLFTFFDGRELEFLEEWEQFYNQDGGGYDMCTAFRQMREKGIQIGEERGIQIGEERVNRLIQLLIGDGRMDEIHRTVSDRGYQEQLFREYGI